MGCRAKRLLLTSLWLRHVFSFFCLIWHEDQGRDSTSTNLKELWVGKHFGKIPMTSLFPIRVLFRVRTPLSSSQLIALDSFCWRRKTLWTYYSLNVWGRKGDAGTLGEEGKINSEQRYQSLRHGEKGLRWGGYFLFVYFFLAFETKSDYVAKASQVLISLLPLLSQVEQHSRWAVGPDTVQAHCNACQEDVGETLSGSRILLK